MHKIHHPNAASPANAGRETTVVSSTAFTFGDVAAQTLLHCLDRVFAVHLEIPAGFLLQSLVLVLGISALNPLHQGAAIEVRPTIHFPLFYQSQDPFDP